MEALDYQDAMQGLYAHIFEPPTEEQVAEWEAEASLFDQEMLAEADACRQMAEDLKAKPMEFLKAALDYEFEVIEVRDVQFAGSKTTMDVVLKVDGEKVHWKIHYQEWAATQWDPGEYDYDIEELED